LSLDNLNKYTDTNAPWSLIKEDEDKTRKVLYNIAE
jgi:methionyl-tRNA synthetase